MFIYYLGILTFHVMYNIKNKIQVSPCMMYVCIYFWCEYYFPLF